MKYLNKFVATVLAATAIVSAPALAHPKLVTSKPAINATVARTGQIDLVFSEKLLAANTRIELVMTSMPGMAMHAAMKMPISLMMGKDGKSIMVMSKRALTPGGYELRWMASGDDKEVVTGKFAFKVK